MKSCSIKYVTKSIVIVFFSIVILFLFCQDHIPMAQLNSKPRDGKLYELFVEKGIQVNNEDSLDSLLTCEYSLSEMDAFFENCTDASLYLNSIESAYPIEVLRENEGVFYTVYKIKEGGYWYLYWATGYDCDPISFEITSKEPRVGSVGYLKKCKDADAFRSLKIGQSTSKEVFEIDPYLEWNDWGSYATYSYSILNKDVMAVVQYVDEGAPKKEDHVIELIYFIHRTDGDCYSSGILDCDLPF